MLAVLGNTLPLQGRTGFTLEQPMVVRRESNRNASGARSLRPVELTNEEMAAWTPAEKTDSQAILLFLLG